MKIVTMCRGGNVRSVALKLILANQLGHQVIAIGADNTDSETKKFLFDWADKVIVLTWKIYYEYAKDCKPFDKKICVLDIGEDIWGSPFHFDLQTKLMARLNAQYYKRDNPWECITQGKFLNLEQILNKIKEYKEKLKSRNSDPTWYL